MLSFIHLRPFTLPIPLLTLTFTLARALSVLLLLLSHLPLGEASTITPRSSAAVNRTIDDELGDSVTGLQPIYSPQADWNQGATCTTCHIGTGLIDPTRVFGGTWHDSTTYPDDPPHTVAATFTGTAVYVFNIVVNVVPDTATLTNLTFFLDGERAGEFVHEPDGSSDVSYNVPVFTTAGLANVPHTLLIQMNAPNITNVLFDYIVYTAEEEDDTTTVTSLLALETASPDSSPTHFRGGHHGSHLPVGAIVGGILGGLAIVALVITAILYFRKRPQRRQGKPLGDDMEKQLRDNREGSPSPFTKHDPGPLQLSPSASVIEISTAHVHAEPVPVLSPGVSSEESSQSQWSEIPPPLPPKNDAAAVASAKRAQRHAELAYQIKALEREMRGLQTDRNSEAESPTVESPTTRIASMAPGRMSRAALQKEITTLRDEVANLRRQLETERRAVDFASAEEPPRYEGPAEGGRA